MPRSLRSLVRSHAFAIPPPPTHSRAHPLTHAPVAATWRPSASPARSRCARATRRISSTRWHSSRSSRDSRPSSPCAPPRLFASGRIAGAYRRHSDGGSPDPSQDGPSHVRRRHPAPASSNRGDADLRGHNSRQLSRDASERGGDARDARFGVLRGGEIDTHTAAAEQAQGARAPSDEMCARCTAEMRRRDTPRRGITPSPRGSCT